MRKGLLALIPIVLVLVSCRSGVIMWTACAPGTDPTGTDGTYVLVCQNGRWVPIMTNAEYIAIAQGRDVTIAPLPSPPRPPTTTTTTTTTTPPVPTSFTSIGGGSNHTCGLTTAGGVECWGSSGYGALGAGSSVDSSTPVAVTGLTSGVDSLTVGWAKACVLLTAGGMRCWGLNELGQLGNGTTTDSPSPVDVTGLSTGVASIGAGIALHTCVVTSTGGAKCWGRNSSGQLGDGTLTDSTTPVDVTGLTSGVASISTGNSHTCAVTDAGAVKCWGQNYVGQVGVPENSSIPTPVDVSGLGGGVTQVIAGGGHTCALTTTGGVTCWGGNIYGALGDGTTTDSITPVDVLGLSSGVVRLSSGFGHTCALTSAGEVMCWGYNESGQLGIGTTTNSAVPVEVLGLDGEVLSVTTGGHFSCALFTAGNVACWGGNSYGQLGDGTTVTRLTPVDVLS